MSRASSINLPKPSIIKTVQTLKAEMKKYDRNKGWYFIAVPKAKSNEYSHLTSRGLIAITAKAGDTTWLTSMLPYGDGTYIIAIPQKVRLKNGYQLGDIIEVAYEPR